MLFRCTRGALGGRRRPPYEQTLLLQHTFGLGHLSADCQTPETRMDPGLHRIPEACRVKDGAVATANPTPVRQHGHGHE